MQRPKVTLVFGTYKEPELITSTLNAIFNQTFQDFKVIIVDDNTPSDKEIIERSVKIISAFNVDKIQYVKNSVNIGVPFVFRKWINLVNTDYFYICGAGDQLLPDSLEKMVHFLENNPKASMVHGLESYENHAGNIIRTEKPLFSQTSCVDPKIYIASHLTGGRFGWSQATALFRTEFFNVKNIPVIFDHYWDFYFHLSYLLFSDEIGYINDLLAIRQVDPKLIKWAEKNVFTDRVERLYQGFKFIDEHEFFLIRKKHPVNRYRIILSVNVLKQSVKLNNLNELLFSFQIAVKNILKVFSSYFLFILFFPVKIIIKPLYRFFSHLFQRS
jgi:glycosyltransferase involved in cell wall biosynthesis